MEQNQEGSVLNSYREVEIRRTHFREQIAHVLWE